VNPIILFELATFVAGLAALVGLWRGYRRFTRSHPGDADNLRAQATVWTSAGVLVMAGANALALLIGPGDVRVLVAGLPLIGVAVWCFVRAFRLRKLVV
jgi:hypothetical protein